MKCTFNRNILALAAWAVLAGIVPAAAQTLPLHGATLVRFATAEESRLAGLQAGASAYLGKAALEDGSLLMMLERLL